MAVKFSDLHTAKGLKTLEEHLTGKAYISGDQLSVDDAKVYAAVSENPGDGFPNVSKWYDSVASHLAKSFPGKAVGVRIGGSVTSPEAQQTEAPNAAAGADGEANDDDDLDLFADETEDEKKAAEEREAAKKDTKKTKESGKSSVLLEVKPWDDETDMKKLEEAVRSVQMPGLTWGASKLVPVGYGIKKLTIMMTIVDDLVSVDNLIEDHLTSEPNNEYIQSVDIVAFNKI
uniref:Elongation factor 1-beta 1 n=1 Tax=Noccaea caerulescens TaxID=107243 RepID=A0A1J3HRW5_NOCCA